MTNVAPTLAVWALALISVLLSAAAQLLMKVGMTGGRSLAGASIVDTALAVALNPYVVGGLACYGVSAVLWLGVLSRMPLSMAYPLVALAIAIVVALSGFLLGEPLPSARLAGAALIIVGVVVIGLKG
jgi:drug/metabolite transporter (DMT)-like permease